MKTLAKILIFLTVAILLAIWSPWTRWNLSLTNILGYVPPERFAGLKVTSLSGKLEVYIDDEKVGETTAEEAPLELFQITPGSRRVKLVRVSDPAGFYEELNTFIEFEPGVDVVVGYELGPTRDFSEGHILTSKAKTLEAPVKLEFKIYPSTAIIFLDDLELTDRIVTNLDLTKQHKVKAIATGYEPLEFIILPDSQEERDKLAKFDLKLDINLMLVPLDTLSR